MNFLKNFFDDDGAIVGLCGFKTILPKSSTKPAINDSFFDHFNVDRHFETNYAQNALLF